MPLLKEKVHILFYGDSWQDHGVLMATLVPPLEQSELGGISKNFIQVNRALFFDKFYKITDFFVLFYKGVKWYFALIGNVNVIEYASLFTKILI